MLSCVVLQISCLHNIHVFGFGIVHDETKKHIVLMPILLFFSDKIGNEYVMGNLGIRDIAEKVQENMGIGKAKTT